MRKVILKAAAISVAMLPLLTSCYDDSPLWEKIDDIENRIDALEQNLNEQFQALNSIIEGKTTVSACEKNADGSYDITLSNGTKFTVMPDGTDYSSLVSVITVNGVKCWATYDAGGNLVALTNDAGQPVPVVNDYRAKVEVVVEDGKYFLVIDGKRYMTGYDTEDIIQVFTSCTPLTDASGNVYAMTFTFGDGIKVTVAVDGYNGIIFRLPSALNTNAVLSEYYISNKDTQSIQLVMSGVVDYVMQIPDGWRVKERTDEYTGNTLIDITAPAAETIAAGAAVAEGDLKVVSVLEGGKAAVSRLKLSSTPFKVFDISGSRAVIDPYDGVQKFVYGIMKLNEFNEATLLEKIAGLLSTTGDLPAGYHIAEEAINVLHTETLGARLENDASYIFWAIPALYSTGDDAGYYVKEGMFHTHEISAVSVDFGKVTPSLFDAEIEVEISGAQKIFAGTSVKSSTLFEEIIYQINNGIATLVAAPASYKGAASAFPDAKANENVEFIPNQTYVTWIVVSEEDKTSYTVNDIFYKEFKTNSITAGSSLKATLGEARTDRTSISIPVSAEGASLIYYTFLSKADGDRISGQSNDTKAELILEDAGCKAAKGARATAFIDKVKPSTTMWLFVLPVDKDGKYGEVSQVSAATQNLEYNSLSVNVTATEVAATKATFNIEVTGGEATELVYWFGKRLDPFWANSGYLGGTKNNAQQYIALYPTDENIVKCMNKYGEVAADGTLKVKELSLLTDYILIVCAKDASGLYSKGGYKMITTLSADLGNIVRTGSDEWNRAKAAITIDWNESMFNKGSTNLFSVYGLNFSCPTDLTAYIICGSEEYYQDQNLFATTEDKIIDIENYAGRKYDAPIIAYDDKGELMEEPDWYDNEGKLHSGTLMNVCAFHVHGVPERGFVTYFAGSHNENNCHVWEDGACPNYTRAETKIQERCSLEYWKSYFVDRGVTDEQYNLKNAEAYLAAYAPFYEGVKPKIFINNGEPLAVSTHEATGTDDAGVVVDDVIVVLKDAAGNYYEPMYFPVPNLFK